jgi:hypothetical protein
MTLIGKAFWDIGDARSDAKRRTRVLSGTPISDYRRLRCRNLRKHKAETTRSCPIANGHYSRTRFFAGGYESKITANSCIALCSSSGP